MQSTLTCSFPGCGRPRHARDLCNSHRMQTRRGSELRALADRTAPLRARFEQNVDKSGECWEWAGSKTAAGYGRIGHRGRDIYAHVLAFEFAGGHVPPGMVVDHKCRNRGCVRPDHLHAVTLKQNNENLGISPRNTSGIRGVSWDRVNAKWRGTVKHAGRAYNVGRFDSIEAAEAAVIAKRNELHTNNLSDR